MSTSWLLILNTITEKKLCLSVKQHAPVMTTEIFDDVTKLKVSSAVKIHV